MYYVHNIMPNKQLHKSHLNHDFVSVYLHHVKYTQRLYIYAAYDMLYRMDTGLAYSY